MFDGVRGAKGPAARDRLRRSESLPAPDRPDEALTGREAGVKQTFRFAAA